MLTKDSGINIVSWNGRIAQYAKHGHALEALNCFKQMQSEGFVPNNVTFAFTLQACTIIGAIAQGEEIHRVIKIKEFLKGDIFLGNALLSMYAKCCLLPKACMVFEELSARDVVTWTILIAGYTKHGYVDEAFTCYDRMQIESVSPDVVTLLCCLKVCAITGTLDKGQQIHSQIIQNEYLESDLRIGNALVDMYAKCSALVKAQAVFDELKIRDTVSWNALIMGYVIHGYSERALNCYEQMQYEAIPPDSVTFLCSLNACSSGTSNVRAMQKGQELHAEIVKTGLLGYDISIGNALVDMYAKCGFLTKAREVFDTLSVRDVISWNTIMTGYATHKHFHEVFRCFEQMLVRGIPPTHVTFICTLKACGGLCALERGQEIHTEVVKKGLSDIVVGIGNALINMYGHCSWMLEAEEVFDSLCARDNVSWNALITGYANLCYNHEVLDCFEKMHHQDGIPADAISFVCCLKACASLGASQKGQEVHAKIVTQELLERDHLLGNALIDMYVNCGLVSRAQEVFDNLPMKDVISWTSLLTGYAYLGECEEVFLTFNQMRDAGQKAHMLTLVSILNACSHAGLLDEAYVYLSKKVHGMTPSLAHYTCMVDILGRAGQLVNAVMMVMMMPYQPNLVTWITFLGACKKWNNMELGKQAFVHIMQLDGKNVASSCVSISNIYTQMDVQDYVLAI